MREYSVVTSDLELSRIAEEIASASALALDLETAKIGGGASTDPLTGRIRLCSINTGKGRYVIDLYQTGPIYPIIDALASTNAVIVGQNLKYDQKWLLWHYGLEFKRVFDTFRASNVLYAGFPGKIEHDLWALYKRELGLNPEVEELGGSDWDAPTLTKAQLDYAADDIDKLLRLREVLKAKIIKEGLTKIAQLEFQAILPEASIELNGFYLDSEMWERRTALDHARKRAAEAVLLDALPNPHDQLLLPGMPALANTSFNLESPAQILKSLQLLGVKQTIKDADTRETYRDIIKDTKEMTLAMEAENFPILDKLVEYRGYAQRVKSFGSKYLINIHPTSGRIHCSYYPYTDTGRYACSKPNLQQVPRTKDFRECFRAAPGRKLAICDWSNIEMRLVAEISGDKTLIRVFVEERDAHYATAALLSGKTEKEITKDQRQQAKPVNFGFIYGMQAPKLVLYAKAGYGVTLTEGQARKFRKRFFEAYSGIADWHNFILDSGKRRGETRTIWGRRRIIKDEKAHNEFFNSPVQGAGADGLKNSLRVVYDKLRVINNGKPPLLGRGAVCGMVHMVHDEIVVEHLDDPAIEKATQDALYTGMIEGMAPIMSKVPTAAEIGGGYSWAAK